MTDRNFLVAPSGKWPGTVGRMFTPEEFAADVAKRGKPPAWVKHIVLHNTGAPNEEQWKRTPGGVRQRLLNLTHDFKNQRRWGGGPHLFIDDEFIIEFNPLEKPGVHSPSWNRIAWGIECVGDYRPGVDVWDGPGVRDNTVAALAVLHEWARIEPATMRLHKEDPATTHDCPGARISKADMVARIRAQMRADTFGKVDSGLDHRPAPAAEIEPPKARTHTVRSGDTMFTLSRFYGVALGALVDANGGSTSLRVNQKLRIPDTAVAPLPVVVVDGKATVESPPPGPKAPEVSASAMSARGLAALHGEEALVLVPYDDNGVPATGFGHNYGPGETVPERITIKDAFALAEKDLEPILQTILKAVKVPLHQHQLDALGMAGYNLGGGGVARSSMVARLNAGDWAGAAEAFKLYDKALNKKTGKREVLPGLTKRREAESKLFKDGVYPGAGIIQVFDGPPKGPDRVKPRRVAWEDLQKEIAA